MTAGSADPMLRSLRERLRSPESLATGTDPLVRLGALHHLRYTAAQTGVRERIEALLASDPRIAKLRQALQTLIQSEPGRAERVQMIFSDMTPPPPKV